VRDAEPSGAVERLADPSNAVQFERGVIVENWTVAAVVPELNAARYSRFAAASTREKTRTRPLA